MRRALFFLIFACAGPEPTVAQGFGWLFGQPPSYRRSHSHSMRGTTADVPLPSPRPHFSSDDVPISKDTTPIEAAKPEGSGNSSSSQASPPAAPDVTTTTAAPTAIPLPPEKPANLGGAPAVATPPPAPSAPAAAASPTPPSPTAPPAVAPSGATTAFNPREPVADAQCADRLKTRGVIAEATTIGPQVDARCTVVQPMRLVSETLADGSTVSFPDKPLIACITADAFSAYVRDLVAPLAKGTWGTGISAVSTGPGLECRSRDHVFGAKLSAHGQGLAVDIAQLKLADGRTIAVGEPNTDAERAFETAARAGGCGYFHTVLGPGSDSYHRTHWHFDLEVRGKDGDSKYCK